jgi:outer membrane protein assembly factor BamB
MNVIRQPPFACRIALAALVALACFRETARADEEALAAAILDTAGFTGGLIVHVDSSGGKLTAALKANDGAIVHGLDNDAEDVASARKHLRAAGAYGAVSVELWEGPTLPYADRMVNLLVAGENVDLARDEVLRVLCPGGRAVFLSDAAPPALTKLAKPWPEELDEWTHFLHDPGNNAVARDTAVGPPGRVQWTAGPVWSKEHDVTPSVFAPVSGNGRLFYILNEGPICTIDPRLPDRYSVVARDAFNGVVLWKRPMTDWLSSRVIWGHVPVHLQRRLVTVGDRVYVTLGLQAPVTALDAATGAVVREYAGTQRTSEIVASGGRLALVTRKTHALDGLLAGRDGNRFRKGYTGPKEGGDEVLVVREDTGECLWRSQHRSMPLTLAVAGDRVLFAEDEAVVCLDLDTGEPVWTAPCAEARTLVVHGATVFAANAHREARTRRLGRDARAPASRSSRCWLRSS